MISDPPLSVLRALQSLRQTGSVSHTAGALGVTQSAVSRSIGKYEAAIGLTIVALGTSLPELAASTAAALRRRGDVALGNVIGSNMLNLLAVTGATAVIAPLSVSRAFQTVDIPIMAATSVLLAPFLIWKIKLGRVAGLIFLALYVAFVFLALGDASI